MNGSQFESEILKITCKSNTDIEVYISRIYFLCLLNALIALTPSSWIIISHCNTWSRVPTMKYKVGYFAPERCAVAILNGLSSLRISSKTLHSLGSSSKFTKVLLCYSGTLLIGNYCSNTVQSHCIKTHGRVSAAKKAV